MADRTLGVPRLLLSFLALLSLLALAPPAIAGAAGAPPPWHRFGPGLALDGYLVVKVQPGVRLRPGSGADGFATTGSSALDQLCRKFGVVAVEPLFPQPLAAHRDASAFAGLGLDRLFFFVFDQRRDDVENVAAGFGGAREVADAHVDTAAAHCRYPNDPEFAQQWNLKASELDCTAVWDHVTAVSTLVAVIDTGVDLVHADLDDNVWINPGEIANNGVDDEGNGYVDDLHGYDFINGDADPQDDDDHGTHVAGILGAEGNNGLNVSGVNWSVPILAAKVLDQFGSGSWSAIAQGIVYAADQGARVTNMSLGATSGDPTLLAAVQYAAALDVVQVAAAGNYASSNLFYPAAYAEVLSVMATDSNDQLAIFSNFGDWCDVAAPGESILSLHRGGGTVVFSGTSMATPHVAGVAVLLRDLNPQMDRIDVELALDYGARDVGLPGRDPIFQWGILSAKGSYDRAQALHESSNVAARGGKVDFQLAFPTRPGDVYLLLPTLSGRQPGINLGSYFSGDRRIVPVNGDRVTNLSLLYPGIGIFVNFIGMLDANGDGAATLNIPGGAMFSGQSAHFSAITFDAFNLSKVKGVAGSVGAVIQ